MQSLLVVFLDAAAIVGLICPTVFQTEKDKEIQMKFKGKKIKLY